MTLKAGIIGAAGFAGAELCRLLLEHPGFDLVAITSDAHSGTRLSDLYPAFIGKTDLTLMSNDRASFEECDAVFLAVPHTAAMRIAPGLMEGGKAVIDLSADFRLKDKGIYEKWYATEHLAPELLPKAAFGLPEIKGEELKALTSDVAAGKGALVACAGCYPTASSLAAWPAIDAGIVDDHASIVVDAISGITGAGKKPNARNQFCSINESVEAYSVASHRHTPEIEQILGLQDRIVFTPHLAPMNRGLLSTVYLPLAEDADVVPTADLLDIYRQHYDSSPFVSVLPEGSFPKTRSVVGTNDAQVGVTISPAARMVIAVCAIDNLGKGAAGQAVQCANILFGMDEDEGLRSTSALPV